MCCSAALAQTDTGELRLKVTDPDGLAVRASIDLTSEANQYRHTFVADSEGGARAALLPFGLYHVQVRHPGFAEFSEVVEIRSAAPREYRVALGLAVTGTSVVVTSAETLLDPFRPSARNGIGASTLRDRRTAAPGRTVLEMVNTQPGWLLEANGVLHPRGSEYQTQYVVDGIPLTENRSPAFVPEIDPSGIASMSMLTSGFPAEYGRKLGGVIEVTTAQDTTPGFRGQAAVSGGSFDTTAGSLGAQYASGRNTVGIDAGASHTGRYLDPPVERNFTNDGTVSGFALHLQRDFSDSDRAGAIVRDDRSRFLVPNELVQQAAGQRQDRTGHETSGQFYYQHVFGPDLLADVRGLVRDVDSSLWSNPLATPVYVSQSRGFREGYLKGALSAHHGAHEFKFGMEASFGSVRENLAYNITAPDQFDQGTPAAVAFAQTRSSREQAVFFQDRMTLGAWTISAGLRWDRYRFLVHDWAVSPRLGVARYWRSVGLVLRASYDRAFQTPAFENLLVASSGVLIAPGTDAVRLPVRPSRGNFWEAGFSKSLWARLRLDGSYYRRNMDNFADDDLLLNTGESFPIAFRKAEIHGVEAKLEIPRWGRFSGFLSYSNLVGFGELPVTGGLFLQAVAADLLESRGRFAISQDQRNTVRSRFRYELTRRTWVALGGAYGSGLPVELDELPQDMLAQYGPRILSRVNLERGRVRPNFSLDVSAGVALVNRDRRTVRLQGDVLNATGRLNLINFAGLFSGTALAPPRSAALRLVADF